MGRQCVGADAGKWANVREVVSNALLNSLILL